MYNKRGTVPFQAEILKTRRQEMISNKELFLRAYKRQQGLNPDIKLQDSQTAKSPVRHVKKRMPKTLWIKTRYGIIQQES